MVTPDSAGEGEAKLVQVPELLGKTIVEFCFHALEQMQIRGISERDVLATIRHPDEIGLPTQPNRERVRKFKKPTKAIDVVYEERDDRIVVVTAFPKKFPRS
ncbi:MAG: DUF4258 domain-containing protein [Planctomycetia bacterium]|nr:DUF4258 domain-containing protein [Planctomycetia bacterium]